MNRKHVAIIGGAVVVALILVTLLGATSLWIGAKLIRGQADAFVGARDASLSVRSFMQGYGGPGMMWRSEGRPSTAAQDGPFAAAEDMPCGFAEDMPCDFAENMPFGSAEDMPCGDGWQGSGMMGPGMVGGGWRPYADGMPCLEGSAVPGDSDLSSLQDVETAIHDYVERLGYSGLEVTEVMEFEHNYYAIVAEEDTGIGAMELLVDKNNGAIGPEYGPNMMWNARYGMHGRGRGMMGGYAATGEMQISATEAEEITQGWLDANLPGRTAGEADPFYGYYTLHFLKDGEIEGMLSVHGIRGDVWYHSWHGDFIAMEGHE